MEQKNTHHYCFVKRALTNSFLALGIFSLSVHAAQPALPGSALPEESLTNRIIVKYKNTAPASFAASSVMPESAVNHLSSITGNNIKHMRKLATGAQLIRLEQRKSKAEIDVVIRQLMTDPNVEYAEPDRLLKPMATPSDPRYTNQWHYYESTGGLNLPTAWDVTQGAGVVVGVIDTGYRPHADLNANILPGYDMISDTFVSQDGNGRDSDASDPGDYAPAGTCSATDPGSDSSWHGTHVAGTVAAVSNNGIGGVGVAYNAKVVPIRALGRCGGYLSDIADAIVWGAGGSVSGVPSNANPAQVLNLSLGGSGGCSSTEQSAINTARSLGTTVVVAAGNSSANAANHTPASCNGVVVVAAVDRSGGRAWYSNYGSIVDVAAPGGDTSSGSSNGVLSTLNSGATTPSSDSYAYYQGTSMATPHVAGAAALVYAVNPGITPDEVETILKSSARSFPASCSQCGTGIVDAAAAVAANPGGGTGGNEVINESNLSGSRGSWLDYSLQVPAGASSLQVQMSGGSGDADLYVRFGSLPTQTVYECRPYLNGNNETCSISNPQAGTWYVRIRAYSTYSGVSLVANVN